MDVSLIHKMDIVNKYHRLLVGKIWCWLISGDSWGEDLLSWRLFKSDQEFRVYAIDPVDTLPFGECKCFCTSTQTLLVVGP